MDSKLENLLRQSSALWRGSDISSRKKGISSGYPELDRILPNRGWPRNSIVEIMVPQNGLGELQLLLPAMSSLSRSKNWLVWIEPPFLPYAPALEAAQIDLSHLLVIQLQSDGRQTCTQDIFWTAEKALRTPGCGMALLWANNIKDRTVRRLQVAAESGQSIGILFRPVVEQTSPAALRLVLKPAEGMLQVNIVKARGTCHHKSVKINFSLN